MKDPDLDDKGYAKKDPGTIKTWTGRYVNPLAPKPEDIHIHDIAHSLARLCRWNGHCDGFLSVARHSMWVANELPTELKLWGLLHDATEAYLGDMTSPVKHSDAMQVYRDAEARLEQVIAEVFHLPYPMPDEVHDADRYVLVELELGDGKRETWDSSPTSDEYAFRDRFVHYSKLTPRSTV